MHLLLATRDRVLRLAPETGELRPTYGREPREPRPTCLAADRTTGRVWCGTEQGVRRSDDGGESWIEAGLDGEEIAAVAPDPAEPGVAWVGTEPSAVYRTADGGRSWTAVAAFDTTPPWLRGLAVS